MQALKSTTALSLLVIALTAWSSANAEDPPDSSTTKNDRTAISGFASLLDQRRSELDGCRGEWQGRSEGASMAQIMCRQFDGPGEFKGVGTTVVLIGQRISMIATQLDSREAEAARENFERLRREVGSVDSGCELSRESEKKATYQCDGHRVSISYSQAAGQWSTSLTLAQD
jgi:hypothetical protein